MTQINGGTTIIGNSINEGNLSSVCDLISHRTGIASDKIKCVLLPSPDYRYALPQRNMDTQDYYVGLHNISDDPYEPQWAVLVVYLWRDDRIYEMNYKSNVAEITEDVDEEGDAE